MSADAGDRAGQAPLDDRPPGRDRLRVLFLASRTRLPDGKVPPHGSGAHVAATLAGLRDHFEVLPVLAEAGAGAASTQARRLRRVLPGRLRGARHDALLAYADRRFAVRARAQAASFAPAVVYERSEYFAVAGARIARELGVPLVLEVDGLFEADVPLQYRSLAEPLGAALERFKRRRATTIVVESPGMAHALEQRGVSPAKLALVPNAIPTWKLAQTPKAAGPGAPVIGWIGHLMPWYRESLAFLIEVAPRVVAEVPEIRFEIVAGGPGLDELRERARRLGVGASFTFRGEVDYEVVPRVLAGFDIGVIPGAFDVQFPVKLVEMGGAGLALVAPRTRSIAGLLEAGVEFEPFVPGSADELAAALIGLARDPSRRERRARAIHDAVAARFTWPTVGRALAEAVYGAVGDAAA